MRAGYLSSYLHAVRRLGIDPTPALDRHHLPVEFERLPEYMVSARDLYGFIEEAVTWADPGVISTEAGFHHARCEPNPFREDAGRATNLMDAIERHNEQAAGYGPGARFALHLDERRASWSKTTRSPMAETEIFCVASLIGHVRTFTHARWLPDAIEVGVVDPQCLIRQPQLSGVPVGNSRDYGTHIFFPTADLWQTPPCSSGTVSNGSEHDKPVEPDFIDSIRLLMKGLARTGNLKVEHTARAARLTTRTLQRRLHEGGVSHSLLADEVRFEVSRDLLMTAPQLTVTEIAFELGYRDPGSFSRAFRRFAGMSPAECRRQQVGLPGLSAEGAREISTAAAVPR